jgi:hypothetical protein
VYYISHINGWLVREDYLDSQRPFKGMCARIWRELGGSLAFNGSCITTIIKPL